MEGNKVRYIKINFEICDKFIDKGFFGIWWGYYKEEIFEEICDVVLELDFNVKKKCYEV